MPNHFISIRSDPIVSNGRGVSASYGDRSKHRVAGSLRQSYGHRHRVRLRSRRGRARDLIASFGWTSSSCNRYVGFGPAAAPTRGHAGGWTACLGVDKVMRRSNANARRCDGNIRFCSPSPSPIVVVVGVEIPVQKCCDQMHHWVCV